MGHVRVTISEPGEGGCRKPTTKALGLCAKWLQWCLHNGWPKSTLDDLERLWWEYHDENGDLVDQGKESSGDEMDGLKVVQSSREVIEHKLLTSLDDSEKVAILCDREMLNTLIDGLHKLWRRGPKTRQLVRDLERLRKEAFSV